MKFFASIAIFFVVCITASLMSMEPDVRKAKFRINPDKGILQSVVWGRTIRRCSYSDPVCFNEQVTLDDESYKLFCFGCVQAEQKMVKIKALLESKEKKIYETTIRPLLVKDPSKVHFIVMMKPYELCIDKL